jgi:hypothetical protein
VNVENPRTRRTHRDLLPADVCPSLLFKALLTGTLDHEVGEERTYPGDGYFWCARTSTPVGVDDELVFPDACRPGRGCYEGIEA